MAKTPEQRIADALESRGYSVAEITRADTNSEYFTVRYWYMVDVWEGQKKATREIPLRTLDNMLRGIRRLERRADGVS